MVKLSFAVLGPVLVITVVAFVIIYFMKQTHQKRLLASRSKQDPDSYLVSDDLLRATSAGDSTLRVILNTTIS